MCSVKFDKNFHADVSIPSRLFRSSFLSLEIRLGFALTMIHQLFSKNTSYLALAIFMSCVIRFYLLHSYTRFCTSTFDFCSLLLLRHTHRMLQARQTLCKRDTYVILPNKLSKPLNKPDRTNTSVRYGDRILRISMRAATITSRYCVPQIFLRKPQKQFYRELGNPQLPSRTGILLQK